MSCNLSYDNLRQQSIAQQIAKQPYETGGCTCGKHKPKADAPAPEDVLDLVTERDINDAFRDNKAKVYCTKQAIITPAATDRAAETGVDIIRVAKEVE